MKSTEARISKPHYFAKITYLSSEKKIPAKAYLRKNKACSSQKQFWVSIEITRHMVEINMDEFGKVSVQPELLQGQISFQMGFGVCHSSSGDAWKFETFFQKSII